MNGSPQAQRRILSIDGGGVRGLLSARVLSHIEARLRERGVLNAQGLAHNFDMMVGTSSGAIPPRHLVVPQVEVGDLPPAATLMDGALFANNPAMTAWAEARELWPQDEICILSVGTGGHQDTCHASAPGLCNREALIRCRGIRIGQPVRALFP